MAKVRKRRKPRKKLPKMSRRDQMFKRKRSTAENVLLILGIFIVVSMLLSLIVFRGSF
jgi:hypothetical protein